MRDASLTEVIRHVRLLTLAQQVAAAGLAELRVQSDARLLAFETVVARLDKLPTVIGLSDHLAISTAALRRVLADNEILKRRLEATHKQVHVTREELRKLRDEAQTRVTIGGSPHRVWCRSVATNQICDCGAADPSPNQKGADG